VTLTRALPALLDDVNLLDDDARPSCAEQAGSLCSHVWAATESRWLATASDWFVAKPVVIALIILGALLVRFVLHRLITRLTRVGADARTPALLRPFRERASSALAASGLVSERRRQRADTMGSVLRSVVSVVVFVVALTLILDQFDVNLAPLVASAGVAGVALGFGAQSLVKDYLSGVFMILEDQYGVGDIVDMGEVGGTVENVGLRVTTVRDVHGVAWYIRNGEIVRVGNKSQGWAQVVVDVPLPLGTDLGRAEEVLHEAAESLTEDEEWADDLLAAPEVLGVEQLTAAGALLRVAVRTTTAAQWRVARELRGRITVALDEAGIVAPAPPSGS
jgi:small conductance mechanosensitive channel